MIHGLKKEKHLRLSNCYAFRGVVQSFLEKGCGYTTMRSIHTDVSKKDTSDLL